MDDSIYCGCTVILLLENTVCSCVAKDYPDIGAVVVSSGDNCWPIVSIAMDFMNV